MPERIYLATKDDLNNHIKDILYEFNVAEGPITAGDLVEFINSKNVADSWGTPSVGAPVVFESAQIFYISATILDSGKVLVAYQDKGNSGYGTACILTVSGTTITVGTPVVFESANTEYISATALDSGKVLVAYRDDGNNYYGTACILTVSGTTITVGTPVVFESAVTNYISATTLNSGKVLVAYGGNSNQDGTACILTVSGTAITAGTPVVFESVDTDHISATTLDSGKVLVAYRDVGSSGHGITCILTVSGTTITAGTPIVFENTIIAYIAATTLDSEKVLVAYRNDGNSYYGTACILTINGTTITVGTPVVFESANATYMSATTLDSGKVLVAYQDDGNSRYGTACILTVSGTTITVGTPVVFESASTSYTLVTTLDSGKVIVAYRDNGNSNYGTACVLHTSANAGIRKLRANVSNVIDSVGTSTVFEGANTDYISATTLDSGKVLVAYRDVGNNYYGTACILTINGTTITAGTPVVFESAITYYISATTLDSGKVLVAYQGVGNSYYGTACILTINGTTITAGTPVVFESTDTDYISATTLDSGKVLVAYRDVGNNYYGTACILTINGTTITAGTPVVFKSAATQYISATTLDSGKVLVAYQDVGNSYYGTACILTINGTTITAGTPVVFESANTGAISATTLDSGRVLVAYSNAGNSNYGTACVLTVSGTTIAAGTPVVFESASTGAISATTLDSGKVLVAYRDVGNSNYGTACILTINGTTITAGTPVVFESAITQYISATTLDSGKVLVAYRDYGNSNYGTACILTTTTPTNITASFLARAEESKTTGQKCQVKVAADKVTKLLNNLIPDSTYYLTTDGVITTEPTETKLGVALSTNKLYRL